MSGNVVAIDAYRTVAETHISPARMIAMGFDGLDEYLVRAKRAFNEQDLAGRATALDRAFRIVEHFLGALDPESDLEVVENLKGLYLFLLDRISRANIFGDESLIDECVPVVADLRDAWTEVARNEERS